MPGWATSATARTGRATRDLQEKLTSSSMHNPPAKPSKCRHAYIRHFWCCIGISRSLTRQRQALTSRAAVQAEEWISFWYTASVWHVIVTLTSCPSCRTLCQPEPLSECPDDSSSSLAHLKRCFFCRLGAVCLQSSLSTGSAAGGDIALEAAVSGRDTDWLDAHPSASSKGTSAWDSASTTGEHDEVLDALLRRAICSTSNKHLVPQSMAGALADSC